MLKFDKKTILGLLAFIVVAAGLFYVLVPLGLIRYFTDKDLLVGFIAKHKTNAAVIFISLQILQVVAAPIPGEVTGFVGGIFFGTVGGILYSTIGLALGSWLAFALARTAGSPLIEKIVRPETIRRYDYVMKHRGLFLAFLMFLIPGFPKDILCYILGLGHMRHRDFLVVSTGGRLLGTILLTVEGKFFRDRHYAAFFTILSISIILIIVIMVYRSNIERWLRSIRVRSRIKERAERKKRKKQNTD